MKKLLSAAIANCLLIGSAYANQQLSTEDAIGMAGLMICDVFYSDIDTKESAQQAAIIKKLVTEQYKTGIEHMMMTQQTSDELDLYIAQFKASDEPKKVQLCQDAINYTQDSTVASLGMR
ncbi:hypothetical protein [Shewanella japonica]|uniref:Uncharacterized protein n=1 Tax=Shewanella japonica TaxID=93973 RepID=A0ABN4YLI9_9GAMM|nr:hypothetical protein [Shewanella japonica]ARD24395.1 hypothetical protein SJ2017_4168 [Shewanella japonica]